MRTSVTIPFIIECLKGAGLDIHREEDLLLASLAQEDDLIVKLKGDKISIAVALPEGENDNVWFSIESECRCREQFEDVFDVSFKQLLESVRKYTTSRYGIKQRSMITSGVLN